MSEELKPVHCGCGGEAEFYTQPLLGCYVICGNCGMRTRLFINRAEAIIAWNRAMRGSAEEKLKAFWDGMSAEMKEERTAKATPYDKDSEVKQQLKDGKNEDLIRKQDAINALVEKGQSSKRYKIGDFWELNLSEIKEALYAIPSVETEIIHCCDCKWWDRLEDGHPYGDCRACRSGTQTERWDIHIQRQCKYDFYCADAEPKENEDDDE